MAAAEPVDIEGVVRRWADTMFDMTKSKEQSKIPREALEFNINWKRVHFKHGEPEYTDLDKPPKPKSQVLFRTFFTNRTGEEQEYSFRTSRVTCSTCDVTVEQCYTVGYEMNISLKTPCEVFEANAGFHREMSLTNSQGQSVEEELAWEVDSQIKVPKNNKTTAELVISEDQYCGNFTLTSEISGKVLINVTNNRDNNSLVKVIEGNIVEILRGMKDKERGIKVFQLEKHLARFVTRGRCNFRYAVEQHVVLHQEELTTEGEEE